ncbi:hypothetical protein SETIT_J030100v2 [Setaria italica]|uniref:NB-ARC domain-containing protein n=2 Tax=Setaria italica TaxID=4555 RepID=K4APK4_SETIT|nr:hypothetical protein SETIT_J030100v2 [Setaria italica]
MDSVSSAVIGEFVRRTVSSLLSKCERQAATDQEDLKRLRSLLLRSHTILEEAERRHVASRAMLQQVMALRDKAFRGYYVLDAVGCRSLPGGGERRNDDGGDDDEEEEVSCDALALSRSNTVKRVRFSSNSSSATGAVLSGASPGELHQMVCSLEAMINDMKEFVVFLMGYPILHRQPYSAHFFVERCMFGRHMERDMIMEFLLQTDPPSNSGDLGVLPITGPSLIGKSTIVEHVCIEERVRNHFSLILSYCRNELKDETMPSFRDNCVIKHQNDSASEERLLIIIELLEDVDDETWKRLYSSTRSIPRGSKMIITSRSKKIERFGTTEALRLKCLPTEAYWYYFKMLVFGSEDPRQLPKLTSLAMEIAYNMPGSFIYPHVGSAILLKGNFSTKRWSLILTWLREYLQKNVSLLGEEHPDDLKAKDELHCTWTLSKHKPSKYFMLRDIYQSGSTLDKVPDITFVDLMLSGCDLPQEKYEVLVWKSRIPPYFNYICTCDIMNTAT